MSNYFIIKKIYIVGDYVNPVVLKFGLKLTIITGGSDSGKTYLFNLIRYLFGTEELSNSGISEASGYERAYIEFVFGEQVYTIERNLLNNKIYYLYGCAIDDLDDNKPIIKMSKTVNSSKSFNSIFYEKMSFSKAKIRTNASGAVDGFNLNNVFYYFCIDEIRILTAKSLLLSDQYSDDTKYKSSFKFILTQRDDGQLGDEKPNKKAKGFLKSQVKELIDEISRDLIYPDMSLLAINEKIEDIDNNIEINMKSNDGILDFIREKINLIDDIENEIIKLRNKENYILMMINRFSILEKCYLSDLERVNSISQASFFLENFSDESCHNCGYSIKNISELNYDDYYDSCMAESKKINSQLKGLTRSIESNHIELKLIIENINDNEYILNNEVRGYNELLETDLKASQRELDKLYELKETFLSDLSKHKIVNSLENRHDEIDNDVYDPSEFDQLKISEIDGVINEFKCFLNSIKFNSSENNTVSFDENKYDFIINEKPRALYGKGSRSVIYACFVISLAQYLAKNKKPHTGFVLLDSPLVTHYDKKRDIKKNEVNPVSLTDTFYSHLIDEALNIQVILIENKGPSFVIHNNNAIKWIDLNSNGSTGLFPKTTNIDTL